MKPVEKVEVSEKHIILRVVILIIAILGVIGSVIFIIVNLSTKDKGWTRIELSRNRLNDSYYFYYNLGDEPTKEYKELTNLYKAHLEKAYILFDAEEEFEDVNNVYYINNNPNKEITVDSLLYNSIKEVMDSGSNTIFMGGIVSYYDAIILGSASNATYYDIKTNDVMKERANKYISYINDTNHFEFKLLGDNKVKLYESEEFMKFLSDYEVDVLNFSYLKNAFILDYLDQVFSSKLYKSGYIYSLDGYLLNLGSHIEYTFDVLDETDSKVSKIASLKYAEKRNIVTFKNTITSSADLNYIKVLNDNTRRTYYIDNTDGISKEGVRYLTGYSSTNSLSKIALEMEKAYIADTFDSSLLKNNNYIWLNDKDINYTEEGLKFTTVIDGYKAVYAK